MTFIALLRAINLGAHNRISMTALREMLADMGMRDVRTLVQSGNVVFEARTRSTAALEKDLERATAARLDVTTDYVVRTPDEWRSVVARNPFVKEAVAKPNLVFVMALKRAPDRKAVAALEAWVAGPERLRVDERHVYLVYPGGIGRSRLTGALIEKRLGVRGTARNWNTVLKLAEMTA